MLRSLRRFFVPASYSAAGQTISLPSREAFHLHKVLRLKTGDECQIFNQKGQVAEAVIEILSEIPSVSLKIKTVYPEKQPLLFIKAVQALPQKGVMDTMIQKAEELGVRELWAAETERTVVKMTAEAKKKVKARWEKIVIEAAKQSKNPWLMRVEGPLPFEQVIHQGGPRKPGFIFHPDPSGISFSNMIDEIKSFQNVEAGFKSAPTVSLFFGPEGGFTESEIRLAESKGLRKVFLGNTILRVETAFLGVVTALKLLMEK